MSKWTKLDEILADHRHTSKSKLKKQVKDYILQDLVGENMTMESAIRTKSDAGAGYVIGVNSIKDHIRRKLSQEYIEDDIYN